MLSRKLTLDKIPHLLKDNRVLMRTDFNVPLKQVNDKFEISDTKRIVATLPSINFIIENKAKSLVMMSHLGRPDGQALPEFSMRPLVPAIEDLLKRKVTFLDNCVGEEVERECREAKDGRVILLENLRFHLAEEGKGVIDGNKVKAKPE